MNIALAIHEEQSVVQLPLYERMLEAIADAKSVDEVKDCRDTADAMRAAARIANNKQAEIDLAEIRFRAERRLGELMAAQREAGLLSKGGGDQKSEHRVLEKPIDAPITLAEAGIDKNLADRARKYAAIPEPEFEATIEDWRGRVEQETERVTVNLLASGEKHVRGTLGTGENEWYTPDEHIVLARKVMGGIDLDPASSEIANRTVGAEQIFREDDNGLEQGWFGRVWLNPPYAQPAISQFIEKAVAEFSGGAVDSMIVLTHNYTDTRWFQSAANAASAICFTRGRIKFESPTGEKAAPTQGQAFFYFGADVTAFRDAFASIGFVVEVLK
jgi:phage N-6-adenine-methyltransferase